MKILFLLCSLLSAKQFLHAQSGLFISPGTDIFISDGTTFSIDSLSLTPSADFTLSNLSVGRTATVTYATSTPYVSRVFHFSNNTNPFSGVIRFYYHDAELNGLTESALKVTANDGSEWRSFITAANNTTANYIETTALSSRVLGEVTAGTDFEILPLNWGVIMAYRQQQRVIVKWNTESEIGVSHFTVERSMNGSNWIVAIDNLPATNTVSAKQYSAIDDDYTPNYILYRIKQTGTDGRYSYSGIVKVAADNENNRLLVYPNPVSNGFTISNVNSNSIKSIRLYSNSGSLVKTWQGIQSYYAIDELAAGIYLLGIQFRDGSRQFFKLIK